MFPLTRLTLFLCRPCNFYCLPEKNKNIFIPTDSKMFQKIGQKIKKNVRIAKLMLRIIFFDFLDVLNFIMPPTSKKLREHIGLGLCVRLCVRPCIRSPKTVHARVLKFHIWMSHGKIVDARFFFFFGFVFSCQCYLLF